MSKAILFLLLIAATIIEGYNFVGDSMYCSAKEGETNCNCSYSSLASCKKAAAVHGGNCIVNDRLLYDSLGALEYVKYKVKTNSLKKINISTGKYRCFIQNYDNEGSGAAYTFDILLTLNDDDFVMKTVLKWKSEGHEEKTLKNVTTSGGWIVTENSKHELVICLGNDLIPIKNPFKDNFQMKILNEYFSKVQGSPFGTFVKEKE